MKMNFRSKRVSRSLLVAMLGLVMTAANAQTELLAIEFVEDDQEGFDLWPTNLVGLPSESTAEFVTNTDLTSGTTTVTITSNTTLNIPANRGSQNGTPEGYSYQNLYEDLLHAGTPTGFITFDFGGLLPNTAYRFTLYAWDPGATDASDKEWTVTEGGADPAVQSVNFEDPLVDNESFALVFDITTTETGTFQVVNTDGLPQSAINGFRLEALGESGPFDVTAIDYSPTADTLTLTWDSNEGGKYVVKYSTDMTDWSGDLEDEIEADPGVSTTRTFELASSGLADVTRLFFRVERLPEG